MKLLSTFSPSSGVTTFSVTNIDTSAEYPTIIIFGDLELNPGSGTANHFYVQPNGTGSHYSGGACAYGGSTTGWTADYNSSGIICYYGLPTPGASPLGRASFIMTIGNRGSGQNSQIAIRYGASRYGPGGALYEQHPSSGAAACGMQTSTLITSLTFNLSYAITSSSKLEIYGA